MTKYVEQIQAKSKLLGAFKCELIAELRELNRFWLSTLIDNDNFIGLITTAGEPDAKAEKCVILTTRMLWYFSESALYLGENKLKKAAGNLYRYLVKHFYDVEYGGVYWACHANGQVKGFEAHRYENVR